MGGLRMTGLISGMDTESMVNELVKASSAKVDKVKQNKQKTQWKQEAWKGLNTKIYNFYKGALANFKSVGTYKSKKATTSDENKVSVTANSNSPSGSHSVSVKQLASSAYLTGDNIKTGNQQYVTYAGASSTTNFTDMTDGQGNSLNLEGSTISISIGDTDSMEIKLGGEGGVANLTELNAKLAADDKFKGLKASFTDGKITFTNTTEKKNQDGVKEGTVYTVKSDALGIDGDVNFLKDEDNADAVKLTGSVSARYKKEFTSSDIDKFTKLSDVGIAVGTSFKVTINGEDKEFAVTEDTTMSDLADGLSKLGVTANFDANQGRFYINANGTGDANNFEITSTDGNAALEKLGLGSGATKVDAQDAIIDYNGVEYKGSSNTFNLNGLTITAKGVTGTYDKTTGAFTGNSPISINVANDTDKVYESIKNFVKEYNSLIDEMNGLYYEKSENYDPLTDEERSKLSNEQIEKWEEKAKKGLLKRDSTIETLLSNMRSTLNKSITATLADGSEKTFTLASLGIVTGDYTENGKLHILGDADDDTYSGQDNVLKKALEANPEVFSQVFAGTKENPGLGTQMYTSLTKAMSKTTTSRALTFYNDITLEDEVKDYDDDIDKWQQKLQDMEDKYYDQFAKMESAMAKLQSQQSYISSLMGGGV